MIFASSHAMAYMPSPPSQPNGYDEFRTSDGASCRSSVGGNVQVYSGIYSDDASNANYSQRDRGAHLGVSISIGGGKRIDCSRLQEIETRRAELELMKLEAEVKLLEKLQNLETLKAVDILPKL